jgi:hypothetical protein
VVERWNRFDLKVGDGDLDHAMARLSGASLAVMRFPDYVHVVVDASTPDQAIGQVRYLLKDDSYSVTVKQRANGYSPSP